MSDASKKMHEYLEMQQRRKEEYWLRKYGKILYPAAPKKEPSLEMSPEKSESLPPIKSARSGQAPMFHANGPIKSFPMKGANLNPDRRHKAGNVPYHPAGPAHLPPINHPSVQPADSNNKQHDGELQRSGSGTAAHVTLEFTPEANVRGSPDSMHNSPKPQLSPSGLSKQLPGGMLGQAQIGPIVLPPLEASPSQGNLDGKQEISPKDQYHQKAVRDLQMELSVLKAIKSREEVLDRLRVAADKLGGSFGGGAPMVLSQADPLVRLFYRLVGQLRQRTLDSIECIAAWKRKTKSPEPFIYYGNDYLAGIGQDLKFLDEHAFLASRLLSCRACEDPFLVEVTPDGIPIEEATTCDLRRGGHRFSSDALRIRMARKVLATYGGVRTTSPARNKPMPPMGIDGMGGRPSTSSSLSSLQEEDEDSYEEMLARVKPPPEPVDITSFLAPVTQYGAARAATPPSLDLGLLAQAQAMHDGLAAKKSQREEAELASKRSAATQDEVLAGEASFSAGGGLQSPGVDEELRAELLPHVRAQVLAHGIPEEDAEGEDGGSSSGADVVANKITVMMISGMSAEELRVLLQEDDEQQGAHMAERVLGALIVLGLATAADANVGTEAAPAAEPGAAEDLEELPEAEEDQQGAQEDQQDLEAEPTAAALAEGDVVEEEACAHLHHAEDEDEVEELTLHPPEEPAAAHAQLDDSSLLPGVASIAITHRSRHSDAAGAEADIFVVDHDALLHSMISAAEDALDLDDGVFINFAIDCMVTSLQEPYVSQIQPGTFTVAGWEIDRQLDALISGLDGGDDGLGTSAAGTSGQLLVPSVFQTHQQGAAGGHSGDAWSQGGALGHSVSGKGMGGRQSLKGLDPNMVGGLHVRGASPLHAPNTSGSISGGGWAPGSAGGSHGGHGHSHHSMKPSLPDVREDDILDANISAARASGTARSGVVDVTLRDGFAHQPPPSSSGSHWQPSPTRDGRAIDNIVDDLVDTLDQRRSQGNVRTPQTTF